MFSERSSAEGGIVPRDLPSTAPRYRRLSGSAIHYGIQFLGSETPDFSRKQDRIFAYVRDRQTAILRARRSAQ